MKNFQHGSRGKPAIHRDDQLSGPEAAAGQEDLYHDRQFSARI